LRILIQKNSDAIDEWHNITENKPLYFLFVVLRRIEMWQDSTGNLVGLAHGNKGDHLPIKF
jgi:hypothetical protein